MAKGEITGWITVNGQHIPLMKGESKARAVAKFIKKNTYKKLGKRYMERGEQYEQRHSKEEADEYMKEKYGKNWDKDSKHDIKGYSTDPYNKVGKAEDAYKKTWERNSKWIKDYEDEIRRSGAGKYADDYVRSKYPNRDKSKVEYHKAEAAVRLSRLEADKFYKNRFGDTLEHMKTNREKDALESYMNALNKKSSGYKLKETTKTGRQAKSRKKK